MDGYEGLFWPYGGHYGVEEEKYAVLNMQDEMPGRDEIMRLPIAGEASIPSYNNLNAQSSVPNIIKSSDERYLIQRLLPPAC